MIRTRTLYLMASRTDTGIGRLIRAASRFPYNHISVTLDPESGKWYSFSRYVQDAPFYSGFTCETVERFCGVSGDIQVQIYQLQIPENNALRLEAMLPQASHTDSGLIYNHFDALANALGFRLPLPRCHTCLSFACELIGREHLSIRDLCQDIAPCLVYEGPITGFMPDSGFRDEAYFSSLGLIRGSTKSVRQFGTLITRTVYHGFSTYLTNGFRRTAR